MKTPIILFAVLAVAASGCDERHKTEAGGEGSTTTEATLETGNNTSATVEVETNNTMNSDTTGDWNTSRERWKNRIEENDRRIAELKKDKQNESAEVRERYNKRVESLEQRNRDLRNRMDSYKDDGKNDNWQKFRREFNHDMDEMGNAFRDIGRDNAR